MFKYKKYNTIIQFGTGAIGDFIMMSDLAIRAFESNKINTIIIVKKNESFLSDLISDYNFIKIKRFSILTLLYIICLSCIKKVCFIWGIANNNYGNRVFLFFKFIYYFTPARLVALDTKDKVFDFLSKDAIYRPLDKYLYEIGIIMLQHIGLNIRTDLPKLKIEYDIDILKDNNLLSETYILISPTTSKFINIYRTLPPHKWANIINKSIKEKIKTSHSFKIVFICAENEIKEIEDIIMYIDKDLINRIIIFHKNIKGKDMVNLIREAKLFIGLRSGPGAIASVIDMKGKYILLNSRPREKLWNYDFNKNIKIFQNEIECKCKEIDFSQCFVMDDIDKKLYHRCIYYINDNEIIDYIKNILI